MPGWIALGTLLAYIGVLFALGRYGAGAMSVLGGPRVRRAIYALGCCVCCGYSSCFGSIGFSGGRGIATLLLWLSPTVVFAMGPGLIKRMTAFTRAGNITSIADFISSQNGKTAPIAATVALMSFAIALPFMAMLLNAIDQSASLATGDPHDPLMRFVSAHRFVLVAIVATLFTIGLGARRLGQNERQEGLALVVATECLVKLVAFVTMAVFVTWGVFDGVGDVVRSVSANGQARAEFMLPPTETQIATFVVTTLCLLFEPAQFHLTIVEDNAGGRVRAARWIVPLFAIVIGVSIVPILVASFSFFPGPALDLDTYIVAIPARAHARALTLIAMIGSVAATLSLLAVSGTAIAIMISNDLAIPIMLHPFFSRWNPNRKVSGAAILTLRRIAIVLMFALSCLLCQLLDKAVLAEAVMIGLCLFLQIIPTTGIALLWPAASKSAASASASVVVGSLVTLYAMGPELLASRFGSIAQLVERGPFGIALLRPTALFGAPSGPFANAAFWSLAANLLVFGLASLPSLVRPARRAGSMPSRARDAARPPADPSSLGGAVTVGDLEATVTHYLCHERARHAFDAYFLERGIGFDLAREADDVDLGFGENLLTGAIGAASSRLVVSLLLQRRAMSRDEVLGLVDKVSAELQDNRDILIEAIASAKQGMAVYDRHLRLVAANKAIADIFKLPEAMTRLGTPLVDILRSCAQHGVYGPGQIDELVTERMAAVLDTTTTKRTRGVDGHSVFDLRTVRMSDGGLFAIFTDVTEQAVAEEQLEAENERLERRVRERTEQLERLNAALAKAKAEAEEANISKTRFLAAASHDLLQPLNAARLYATSLKERVSGLAMGDDSLSLALNVECSLEAVEEILTALLDISRLDAGATKPEITDFAIRDIFRQLRVEFEPTAKAKGLAVTFVDSSLRVRSDRRLLRRLLQNLVSNAIKYTAQGRVVVGARRGGESARIEVWDTGIGVPKSKQRDIFKEFERLPGAVATASGVGLGLSIVERLSRVLGHEVRVRSKVGRGSVFSVVVPRAEPEPVAWIAFGHRGGARQRSLDGLVVAAVENEPAILRGMEALLGVWDCHFVGGATLACVEAGLYARGVAPDVIIADYHLGDIDGFAAIAELRQRHGPCHAVLLTADRDQSLRDRARAADIRVLNKPLKAAALRSLLSQWRLVKLVAE